MLNIAAGNPITGYNLTRSLRFRRSAGGYLNRTFGSGSQQVMTLSFWFKRGQLGVAQYLFGSYSNGSAYTNLYIESTDQIGLADAASGTNLLSTQVFRDPSAWYHIVVAIDTTQATAANRVKFYVNNVQITAFASSTYPAQNTNLNLNSATNHTLFNNAVSGATNYTDGYLAETNFVNASQLTPSSFGSYNSVSGVWQPARYTGTYGTNGFYLPFTDNSALTTSSNAGLGKDFSGNGNYWTTNNISITAGVTYDSMTDVPTLTSATAANFAVLNPLDKYSSITVSGGNLNAICADVAWRSGAMTFGNFTTGKWYYEVTANSIGGSTYISAGWELTSLNHTAQSGGVGAASGNNFGVYINSNSRVTKVNGSTFSSDSNTNSNGDVLMFAVDFDAGKGWIGKNGTWYDSGNPSAGTSPCTTTVSGGMTPAYEIYNNGDLSFNAGQRPFAYTPPTGFVALNTYNLPTATILKGNTVMDATLYTGTLLSNSVTNAAGFKPDLVWIKSRSAATSHKLTDSVRGVTKSLSSNSSAAESTDAQGLTAFNSNGFTVGTNTDYNNLTATYDAWQWQAGQGTTSSNTSGTITSTVSVNASAGFSVITYTGNGTSGATVGHGLGVAPTFWIIKRRDGPGDFKALSTVTGSVLMGDLNTTNVWGDPGSPLNTAPTSSVITLDSSGVRNGSGQTYVIYAWTPIAGYSSIQYFNGNGSTDGPFVYTGFRPKWTLSKDIDGGSYWGMVDSVRSPYNVTNALLNADLSDAETATSVYDYLSNGVKLRSSTNNQNNHRHILISFAENPFKNALAR